MNAFWTDGTSIYYREWAPRAPISSEVFGNRSQWRGLAVKDWLDADHRSPIGLNSLHLDEPTSVYAKDLGAVKAYRIGLEVCVIAKQERVMPVWKVYHPVGAFTTEDKHAFARTITDLYAKLPLPKFYINVIFQEIPKDSLYRRK